MITRAAILTTMGLPRPYAVSRPLSIADVELDPPGPGEVLIAVRAAGLCHSDLSVIDGVRPRPMPMVLGHEAAGVVEALGEGVGDLPGRRPRRHGLRAELRRMRALQRGPTGAVQPGAVSNGAGALLGGARRLHRAGADLNHHLGVSAFAQYPPSRGGRSCASTARCRSIRPPCSAVP